MLLKLKENCLIYNKVGNTSRKIDGINLVQLVILLIKCFGSERFVDHKKFFLYFVLANKERKKVIFLDKYKAFF